jgi:hypothetical protein
MLDVARNVLEPLGAAARRALQREQCGAPLLLVGRERGRQIRVLAQLPGEPDRILDGQLRP